MLVSYNLYMITEKWKKILDVKLLKSDKEEWGKMPIKRISQSFDLSDDKELGKIKTFIMDEIKFLNAEIKHYKKYSPAIYHPNTYLCNELEIRTFKIILGRLTK